MLWSTSRRKKAWGFTLIELLVVIAIMALLAGLLFPALMQARQMARMAVCLTNLRSVGMALAIYADAEGHYPRFREHYTGGNSWAYTLVNREYASIGLFRCPEAPFFEWKTGNWYGHFISIGYNAYFIGSEYWPLLFTGQAGQWGNPASPYEIGSPHQTIFAADTARIPNTEAGSFSLYPRFVAGRSDGAFARHRNETRINVLWGDGRAEAVESFQTVRYPYPNPYPDLGPDPNAFDTWWDRR